MRHTSRKARDLKRAQANNRARSLASAPAARKEIPGGHAVKVKPWQATMSSVGPNNPQIQERPCSGNVGEIAPTPRIEKDRNYPHGPLQAATDLWTETVTAGDSDTRKGIRKANKWAPIKG
jgi:hypothetical protein